ncbi:ROK family transcriptional regulator [Tropicimonas isoalkanivorans]|uniref:Sugar kinase of the NBD/HSP70 family, may contain an N-terminal HTH domain n=1 Tax=Tropicimonas isoalkanivorans TaxID=441112 RepID=A0A1I1DF61_9RHOB|nr:ROK family transcriptional regulator [Tropicimonas isoalkanivorans]SFB73595.1 Sugar kinase of the NBD/HSP70 family, may contain an N-terminal HTH domain [Tropicimonas isoalkanivorans]
MLKGTNQELGRPHNRRIVLEAIRQHGPISRAEIARRIGLTVQTVSTITAELHEGGFVSLTPGKPKGRGFPAPSLQVNPDGGCACGIYVTPRGIEAGVINLSGRLLGRRVLQETQISADRAFAWISDMVSELVDGWSPDRVIGVGLALPGPFDIESMSFVGPTTMQTWGGVDVYDRLKAAVPFPVFVDVDSAAAAHGERLYGLGDRLDNFYYLFLGVGLGGSIIYNSRVMRGAWGNAGEIGHVPLVPGGELCACGNRGCLERYVSLEAYDRRVAEIGEEAWLEEIAPIFRAAIVTIENLFDPETVVLGGVAPVELRRKLLELADDLPNSLAARQDRTVPRVVLSDGGADAVLLGAASLAVSRVFSPEPPPANEPKDDIGDPLDRSREKESAA